MKSCVNACIEEAYAVLDGEVLDAVLATRLMSVRGEDVLDLVSLANKVRNRFAPPEHVCTIMNAKSGACGENCRFCAQSAHHESVIDVYPLSDTQEMVDKARIAYETGVRSFGIVTSGFGFMERDDAFEHILEGIDAVRGALPEMSVCASLGMLSDETAAALAEHGIVHYNINIQTAPSRYAELIATTHEVDQRVATIRSLQKHGVKVCCGGILGLGETTADRVEMAFSLRELDVDVIPLNVLVPVPGTPLEERERLSVADVARAFAVFRLANPTKTIKFAAGRETRMKDFQGLLMLAGANGMLTGGYLTTRGRDVEEDFLLQSELRAFGMSEA